MIDIGFKISDLHTPYCSLLTDYAPHILFAGCRGVRVSGGDLCRRQKHRPSRQARPSPTARCASLWRADDIRPYDALHILENGALRASPPTSLSCLQAENSSYFLSKRKNGGIFLERRIFSLKCKKGNFCEKFVKKPKKSEG